jgi:ATP-binding cassette subfamily F protein uup
MLAQRGADIKRDAPKAAAAQAPEAERPSKPAASPSVKRRLNFNEKHALETLPKTMAKLQAEIAKQQQHLDDPNLYAKDRATFDKVSAALAKAHAELQEAEDRWLELEMLREEIEGA